MDARPLPNDIADFARAEMARLSVPGLSVGITHNGDTYAEGFGVTSVENPLPVTPETIFQVGSTSKTFTATVAMMLMEEGKLDIEQRVREYVPSFTTSDEEASDRVTIRNLLTHRTGWPGDYFKDFGRGADALEKYVAAMARARQDMQPGEAFSYCNSAFYLLARVIESITGDEFENVVADRLIRPLGMHLTSYHPEDVITHRVATGHILTPNGPAVARPWHMARNLNGGGGINSTALDQVTYARFHINQGLAPNGQQLISRETAARMQSTQAEAGSMCDSYGLGWMLSDHAGHRLVMHGGATNGFLSSFETYPDDGFGVAVLTNSDTGREARNTIAWKAREHFIGLADPVYTETPVSESILSAYIGEYRAMLATSHVTVIDGVLHLQALQPVRTNRMHQSLPDPPVPLAVYAPDRTVVLHGSHRGERCEFIRDADGRIAWLRWDGRVARKL